MSLTDTRDGTATAAEVLATLRADGWTDEDLQAVPALAALLDEEAENQQAVDYTQEELDHLDSGEWDEEDQS